MKKEKENTMMKKMQVKIIEIRATEYLVNLCLIQQTSSNSNNPK